MSPVGSTVRVMPYHPWRRLRALTDIQVMWWRVPGTLGLTNGVDRIVLNPDQSQVERRCTLAHELAHIELGHRGGCVAKHESQARRLAARRLIKVEHLADALLWSQNRHEVAEVLWVDVDTLDTRLAHLHPAERHYITQRLAAREEPA